MSNILESNVIEALKLPSSGRVYDLGHEINRDMPSLDANVDMPFNLFTYRSPEDMAKASDMNGVSFHVEAITGSFHCSTHLDALVHCQYRGRIHGGRSMAEARGDFGWREGGVETVAPMVGRGILFDVAKARGVDILPDGYAVTPEDLEVAAALAKLEVKRGDYVLVRTGKAIQFSGHREAFVAGCPGMSRQGAQWLADRGMAALCIDSTSADPQPEAWSDTAHVLLLVERGIYIVENVYMEELSADGIYEFMFICLPLKFTGGTGSWVRPIAIA